MTLPAQTPSTLAAKLAQPHAAPKPAQPHRRAAAPAQAVSPQPRPAPEEITTPPPASPAPIWPANQPPNQARVVWDSRGLDIEAYNSSLAQILQQVAAGTGAKVEGRIQDQRVFGSYGPGPMPEVLSELLNGSGCNVLILGSRDVDAPLKIVLSARTPAGSQTAANNYIASTSEDAGEPPDPDPQIDPSQPIVSAFGAGETLTDPTQLMEKILDRQHQIDLQQEQPNNSSQ